MASRIVRPETVKLDISNGDWLLVKKRLNAGEQRAMFARMYQAGADGSLRANPFEVGVAKILAYVLDWSMTDLAGKQIAIMGQPASLVLAALDSFDGDTFAEIRNAIDEHIDSVTAERNAEKNDQAGETRSVAISPSRSAADGQSMSSVN